MSSKTKIVVLHLKELIYTGIFVVLGILFIVLLIVMFMPGKKDSQPTRNTSGTDTPSDVNTEDNVSNLSSATNSVSETSYIPGVYSTALVLGDHTVDVEVVVDRDNINSVRLVNLDEAVTTMYPLLQPAFESLTAQIYANQSLEGITYTDDSKYTTLVLLHAIETSLDKALVISEDAETAP